MTTYGITEYALGDAVDIEITAGGVSYRLTETLVEPPTGEPPVASDASLSLTESVQVQINFALYASDPDSAQLKLTAATATNGALANVVLDTLGTMTADYTPPAYASNTSDSISFTVADAEDNSDSGTLTISVLEEGIQGQIVRVEDYTFPVRSDGDMLWHCAPWRDDADYKSQMESYEIRTKATFSHESGIKSNGKSIRINGVEYGNSEGALKGTRVSTGDVIDVADTVTTNSGITEVLISGSMTVQADIPPSAFQAGDVTIVDSPSLDGNELKVTINQQRLGSSNSEVSHYELSTDSTNGTDGTWTRMHGHQMLGSRPALVSTSYSGQPWIRQVNRKGAAAPGYQYPSPVTATVGTPTVEIISLRDNDTRPAPAAFFFVAKAWGFSVANPDQELDYVWTYPAEARQSGRLSDAPADLRQFPIDDNTSYGLIGGCVIDHELVTWSGSTTETFTVSCAAERKSDGEDGTGNKTITVLNPDLHWPNTDTFVVYDPANGALSGQPSGAASYTSLDAAMGAARYKNKVRILFRRGDTFTTTNGSFDLEGDGNLYVGAFGASSTPPKIICNAFVVFPPAASGTAGNNFIFGLDGEFPNYTVDDPFQVEDTRDPGSFVKFAGGSPDYKIHGIWDCELQGFGMACDFGNNILGFTKYGCNLHDSYNYTMLLGDSNQNLFMNNYVWQPVNSVWQGTGSLGSKKFWTRRTPHHGPRRTSRLIGTLDPEIAIQASLQEIIISRTSWQEFGAASQPTWRMGRGRERGGIMLMNRTVTNSTFQPVFGAEHRPGGAQRALMQDCIFSYETCNSAIVIGGPGEFYENCIFILPNVLTSTSSDWPTATAYGFPVAEYGYGGFWNTDREIYPKMINCTMHDQRAGAKRLKGGDPVPFSAFKGKSGPGWQPFDIEEHNMVYLAPDAPSSDVTLDPISDFDLTNVVTVGKTGVRVAETLSATKEFVLPVTPWPPTITLLTDFALDNYPIPAPLNGAAANGSAENTAVLPRYDIFRTARATNSRGAIEPAAS